MSKNENLTSNGDYKKNQSSVAKTSTFQKMLYFVLALMFFGSFYLFLNLSFLLFRNLDYSLIFDFPYFYKIIDFIEYGMYSGNSFDYTLANLLFMVIVSITLFLSFLFFLLVAQTPVVMLICFAVMLILLMKPVTVKKCIMAILIIAALIIVVVYMRENIALCYVLLISILPFFFVKKTKGILTLLFMGAVIFISVYFIDKNVSVLLAIGYFFVFIPKIKNAERNIKIVSAMVILLVPLITATITREWLKFELMPDQGLADFGYELINNYELNCSNTHEVKIYYHNKNTAYRLRFDFPKIPSKVIYAGWDNKFIIAKQLELKRAYPDTKDTYMVPDLEIVNYWILDTEIHKLYGPYNESEFKAERNKLQVPPSLELKRVRPKQPPRPPMTSDDYYSLIIQIYIMLLPFMILLYLFIHRRFLKLTMRKQKTLKN